MNVCTDLFHASVSNFILYCANSSSNFHSHSLLLQLWQLGFSPGLHPSLYISFFSSLAVCFTQDFSPISCGFSPYIHIFFHILPWNSLPPFLFPTSLYQHFLKYYLFLVISGYHFSSYRLPPYLFNLLKTFQPFFFLSCYSLFASLLFDLFDSVPPSLCLVMLSIYLAFIF